jgi:hypothetical protein
MNRNNIFTLNNIHLAVALLGLLLILVSCHREELPITKNDYPIEFSGISGCLETKADDNQTSSLPSDFTGFRVWAQNGSNLNVFGANGTEVSTSDGGQTWTYSPVRYWQAGTYNFYAVSPKDFATGSLSNGALTLTFANGWNLSSQTDIMLATASNITGRFNTDDKPEAVGLTFNHLLSKIGFSVKNADTNNATIKVTSVSISGNHKSVSSYSTTSGWSWQGDDRATNQTLPLANSAGITLSTTAYTSITPSEGVIVFPETECTISVSVTFDQQKGNVTTPATKTATISNQLWQPGYKYDYKLTVTADAIKIDFDPDVTPWGEGGSADTSIGSTDKPIEF